MDRKNHPVESSNKNPESLGISCHVVLVMSSLICKLYLMDQFSTFPPIIIYPLIINKYINMRIDNKRKGTI